MRADMIRKSGVLAICILAGTAANAQTEATRPDMTIPDCTFSRTAHIIGSLKAAPDIAAELKRQGLAVADVGEPFVPYDVVDISKGLPHRQFLRAYRFADRTIAWYYHGGLGTHIHVFELRETVDPGETGDRRPVLRMTGARLSGPPCAATQALLNGVSGPGDW